MRLLHRMTLDAAARMPHVHHTSYGNELMRRGPLLGVSERRRARAPATVKREKHQVQQRGLVGKGLPRHN